VSCWAAAGNQEWVILFATGNRGGTLNIIGAPGTAKNVITVGAAEKVRSSSTVNGGNSSFGMDGCDTRMPMRTARMIKASLMNATRYLTGNFANDNLWSAGQGMGVPRLGDTFPLCSPCAILFPPIDFRGIRKWPRRWA